MKKLLLPMIMFISSLTASAQATELTAVYQVPTDNSALVDLSKFEITNLSINHEKLSFKLPNLLASNNSKTVTFELSEDIPNTYVSLFGQAHCLQTQKNTLNCDVQYNSLYQKILNEMLPKTVDLIKEASLDQREFESRLEVARSFSGDPIGKLIIKLN